jgi:3-phenylpropionate/trans-cinnamate dioxygenase ferredoxin component
VTFTLACSLTDLEEGTPYAATVGDVEVALVRDGEELYAIRDECSHAAIALSEGDVEGCTIECWLHGSAFDLRTGQPTSLPAFEPVPVYPVRVDGDDVLVDVENPMNTEELSA